MIRLCKSWLKKFLGKNGIEIRRVSGESRLTQLGYRALSPSKSIDRQFSVFVDDSGIEFPLYEGYRYSVKPAWMWIGALANLSYVMKQVEVSQKIRAEFADIIGSHTLTRSEQEIIDFALPVLKQHKHLFLNCDVNERGEGLPISLKADYLVQVSNLTTLLRDRFEQHLEISDIDGRKILDVGCGRGLTTASLCALGAHADGLDNDYGDDPTYNSMAEMRAQIVSQFSDRAGFLSGDITSCPEISSNSYDVIFSVSCLEHVQDIDSAFAEMFRVLKPGGTMLHSLNPFWAENGGHAVGTLDAPWLHAMLTESEYERYLYEVRRHEAAPNLAWAKSALNRSISSSSLQAKLVENGFWIQSYVESIGDADKIKRLQPQTLANVQRKYPEIGLADLLATDITFTAIKPN